MTKKYWIVILAVAALAVALRLPRLQMRPMHGDEAVGAYKFGELLEENYYRYDPHEYHGPALNYFTLIVARLAGEKSYASLTELTVRIVPVFFGFLLVLMPLLLLAGIGRAAAVVAAGLTAISPAFVFYSRYYIHEMLLVCFTFAVIVGGYRYAKSGKIGWAICTGVFVGLMHATKETCVIAFGSMLAALALTLLFRRRRAGGIDGSPRKIKAVHLLAAAAAAIIVSALFFSSFLTHPQGIIDSVRTYGAYFSRAGGNQLHIHPWYYYLEILLYRPGYAHQPPWTEGLIVILAAAGLVFIAVKKALPTAERSLFNFLAVYTVIITVVYSAIPYKTPWCLLSFFHGMILLAAVGTAAIFKFASRASVRIILGFAFGLALLDLLLQAYLSNYVFYADYTNPYVYAHPTTDVFKITNQLKDVSAAHPAHYGMGVEVVVPDADYWPLPWYFRRFTNVGWRSGVGQMTRTAPVVIASPDVEDALIAQLYALAPPGEKNLYMPLFDGYIQLRPEIELRGYITKELLDKYNQLEAAEIQEAQK